MSRTPRTSASEDPGDVGPSITTDRSFLTTCSGSNLKAYRNSPPFIIKLLPLNDRAPQDAHESIDH